MKRTGLVVVGALCAFATFGGAECVRTQKLGGRTKLTLTESPVYVVGRK